MHIEIKTINCGSFMVPVEHVTVHCIAEKTRILLLGETEWREIEAEDRLKVLSAIAENNERLNG